MTGPGSPVSFNVFARRCRALVDGFVFRSARPAILVADGPEFEELVVLDWEVEGEPPPIERLLTRLVPTWIEQTGGSQVAISVPFDRPRPGVSLLMLDEAAHAIETSHLDVVRMRLRAWRALTVDLPLVAWQEVLAENAGWQELAKWRCRHCQSVCAGEADAVPTPCDFCRSTMIERVELGTPLREPDPPYDRPSSFWSETLVFELRDNR